MKRFIKWLKYFNCIVLHKHKYSEKKEYRSVPNEKTGKVYMEEKYIGFYCDICWAKKPPEFNNDLINCRCAQILSTELKKEILKTEIPNPPPPPGLEMRKDFA